METKTIITTQKQSLSISIAEFLLMFFLGAFAMVLHAKFRFPLNLPGRHGLEFMMLLLIGRNLTQLRFSGFASSLGVSAMLFVPFLGFHDPFMAAVFILPGIAIDIFYNAFPAQNKKIWMLALASGIAYSLIPISRMIISYFTGFVYESLITGLLFPVFTHFVFGFIGGLGGTALVKAFGKKK